MFAISPLQAIVALAWGITVIGGIAYLWWLYYDERQQSEQDLPNGVRRIDDLRIHDPGRYDCPICRREP